MFARIKKSGRHQYVQLVENRKEQGKVKQRVVATLGRLDELHAKDRIETLVRSLARFSEKTLLVLSGTIDADASAVRIGPALIFERIWQELGLPKIFEGLLAERKFEFNVEQAVFLTVLHRLCTSGSDRNADSWRRDYAIDGIDKIALHHVYRAMAFLGEELAEQREQSALAPRCTKDLIEEGLFRRQRTLFTGLDLVFFDATSIYFEGAGGKTLGQFGHSKDHRPDRKQMVVGALLDDNGRPICGELWPGNTADVKSLLPVVDRVRRRFGIQRFCIVADRGMISAETIAAPEGKDAGIAYILGARMRRVKEVSETVLSRPGRYHDVITESAAAGTPSPLAVKEIFVDGRRYIVCRNGKQARKDAAAREAMVAALEERLRSNPKALVGNRGYARFLKVARNGMVLDRQKIEAEARFDGKWVLRSTMNELSAAQIALKYKELWQVEQVFRDVKSVLDTRPIYHRCDETIRGHVFCSFLALVLRKELDRRLDRAGCQFEWADIRRDLKALQVVTIEEGGRSLQIRTAAVGCCGKVFQAVGVALPPTIREI